jgi:hypothetical protein
VCLVCGLFRDSGQCRIAGQTASASLGTLDGYRRKGQPLTTSVFAATLRARIPLLLRGPQCRDQAITCLSEPFRIDLPAVLIVKYPEMQRQITGECIGS